jgi:hypothetical protein
MPNTKCTHRCSVCSTFMNDRGHRDLYELKVLRKSFNIFVVQSHQFGHVSLIWARANLTIFRIGRNKIFQSLFRVLNILFCQWRVPSLFIRHNLFGSLRIRSALGVSTIRLLFLDIKFELWVILPFMSMMRGT